MDFFHKRTADIVHRALWAEGVTNSTTSFRNALTHRYQRHTACLDVYRSNLFKERSESYIHFKNYLRFTSPLGNSERDEATAQRLKQVKMLALGFSYL